MTSVTYCALLPKPFPYCQLCSRNPLYAEPSWKTSFKLPIIDRECLDFIKKVGIDNE